VVRRAAEILRALEQDELQRGGRPTVSGPPAPDHRQLGLFQPPPASHAVLDRLRQLDVDRLTPLDALTLVAELKREADA
jgi:DNA mismatch repair protein MutS